MLLALSVNADKHISGVAGSQSPGTTNQLPTESMYKCQLCGVTSAPRIPATKITVETRSAVYLRRERANACFKRLHNKFGEFVSKYVHTNDNGGKGVECVIELTVCPVCAAHYNTASISTGGQRGQPESLPSKTMAAFAGHA
jgi:hypothetical protein